MKHNLLEEYCEMIPSLSVIQHLNPSCYIYEWISFTTPWYFLAPLEFKCMQWSKLCLRKQRWCNKKKPPDYSHRRPTSTQSKHSMYSQRWYCKPPPGGRSAQECFFFSISPSLMTFFSTVCLVKVSLGTHVHADAQMHTSTEPCICKYSFCWGKSRCLHAIVGI